MVFYWPLLTLGQLSEAGEITALRASGFSFVEMTWPFLSVAVGLSGLLFYLNHKVSPDGFHAFREQYLTAAQQIARVDLEPGAFVRLGQWKLFAKEVNSETGKLGGVYLVRLHGDTQAIRINAERGQLRLDQGAGVTLELEDGELQLPNNDPSRLTSGTFERYTVVVPLAGQTGDRHLDIQELNTPILRGRVADPATSDRCTAS